MRRVPRYKQSKDGNGRKRCLVCATPLPPRRSSYCSDECWIRNTPQMIRRLVEDRDKGVCALCGTKCRCNRDPMRWENMKEWRNLPRWEADHIVPVAEGGGLCGVDGYRTLCKKCHAVETGKLRKRLNEKKRMTLFTA